MTNTIFIEQCESVGLDRAIALSSIKWFSSAIRQDSYEVISLLYELSTFFDTVTICKRLKMYAMNRIERGKPAASIEELKGVIDDIIANNGNEGKSERSNDTESIEQLTLQGWDRAMYDSHFEKFDDYDLLADIVYFIRQHNLFERWVDVDDFDTKTSLGQSNSRQIRKDIAKIFDYMGNRLDGAKITPSNMVKLCRVAKYGYLVA